MNSPRVFEKAPKKPPARVMTDPTMMAARRPYLSLIQAETGGATILAVHEHTMLPKPIEMWWQKINRRAHTKVEGCRNQSECAAGRMVKVVAPCRHNEEAVQIGAVILP